MLNRIHRYSSKFNKSIARKVLLFFVLSVVIPLLVIAYTDYTITHSAMQRRIEHNISNLVKEKVSNASFRVKMIEGLMIAITSIEDIHSLLKQDIDATDTYSVLNVNSQIGHLLGNYLTADGIEKIYIFTKEGVRFQVGQVPIRAGIKHSAQLREIISEQKISGKTITWHALKTDFENDSEKSIYISKTIYTLNSETMIDEPLGTLVVKYDLNVIRSKFEPYIEQNLEYYVADNKHMLISCPKKCDIGKQFCMLNEIVKEKGTTPNLIYNSQRVTKNGERGTLINYKVPAIGWGYFAFISDSYFVASTTQLVTKTVIIFLSLLIISTIFVLLIYSALIKPLKLVTHSLESIYNGNYNLHKRLKIKGDDEIASLVKWLNIFIKQLKHKEKTREELLVQKELAEVANKAKDSFLASVSHELRTPLNGVVSVSELLGETQLDRVQTEYVSMIMESSEMLHGLINQVLDFSKIDSDKLTLSIKEFDLITLIDKLAKLYRIQCSKRGIKFTYISPKISSLVILSDEMAIQKILINLLGNSLKYTPSGEIVFTVTILKQQGNSTKIRFQIADSGIGIPIEKQSHVFEAFQQVDDSLSKKIVGSGLGLAIAQQLARLLKGNIQLISPNPKFEKKHDKGSIFYLELDCKMSSKQLITKIDKNILRDKMKLAYSGKVIKCLIIEDNKINQKVLVAILKRYYIITEVASTWQESMALVNAQRFDYIFMDIQLPEMTGFELTTKIRELGIDTPVIAVTGNSLREMEGRAYAAGMDEFLVKPVRISDIERVLYKFKPEV